MLTKQRIKYFFIGQATNSHSYWMWEHIIISGPIHMDELCSVNFASLWAKAVVVLYASWSVKPKKLVGHAKIKSRCVLLYQYLTIVGGTWELTARGYCRTLSIRAALAYDTHHLTLASNRQTVDKSLNIRGYLYEVLLAVSPFLTSHRAMFAEQTSLIRGSDRQCADIAFTQIINLLQASSTLY